MTKAKQMHSHRKMRLSYGFLLIFPNERVHLPDLQHFLRQ